MSNEEPNEEQKQAKQIIERWQSRGISLYVAYICVPSCLIPLFSNGGWTLWKVALCIGLIPCWWFLFWKYALRNIKVFLGGLSLSELQGIDEIACSTDKEAEQLKRQAENLLKQYKSIYYKEEAELLRASKPTSDETLLRPTGNNKVAKEELLRAVRSKQEKDK